MTRNRERLEAHKLLPFSRQKVLEAWTAPEHFARWHRPRDTDEFILHQEPGRQDVLYTFIRQFDISSWNKFVFDLSKAPAEFSYTHVYEAPRGMPEAAYGNIPGWPHEMLTTVRLVEMGPTSTEVWKAYSPVDASEAEIAAWLEFRDSQLTGVRSSLDALEAYLSTRSQIR
ncbi:SRPBCC domain-containing protein [Myxococcaceae bacterium GXIMD 01537]